MAGARIRAMSLEDFDGVKSVRFWQVTRKLPVAHLIKSIEKNPKNWNRVFYTPTSLTHFLFAGHEKEISSLCY